MKLFIRYLVPKTPCNIDPLLGSAIVGGIGSAISAGLGALGMSNSSKKNFQYNKELMRIQQEYNLDNMHRQYELNQYLSRYGYELEKEYNSPSAQKKRMIDAGLNPYYNEQGAVTAQSNPNMQSVSQPSVSIPNFQSQSPWSAFANLPADFAAISNAYKALADAKKVGVETEQQQKAMDDFLKLLSEQVREEKLKNDYQEVITNWYQQTGTHYLNEQDRELSVRIGLMCAQGNLADAEKLLTDEKYKQLKNENSLWSQIKDYIVRQKAAEAESAEEQTKTIRKQGLMYEAEASAVTSNAISNRITANANFKQAVTAEENGKSYRINLKEASKLTQAQKNELIQNSIAMYEDATGVHLNKAALAKAQGSLLMLLQSSARQQYINSINPLTYLGSIFGGAMNIGAKVIK